MSLSDPRQVFGIHSFTPYSRTTGLPFGTLKVTGDSEVSFAASSVDNRGGSNKSPWGNEITQIEGSLSVSAKAIDDFLYEKFMGASVATTAASATGTVGAITNKSGSSVVDTTTGIASVAAKVGSESDLKFARYIVKAVSATTVDIYADTDLNFKTKGTKVSFDDDLLKLTASALTVPDTGGTVDLTGWGIEITGGSGAVALVTGDTAVFDAVGAHGGISDITVLETGITFPEFGAFMYAQERSSGEEFRIHAFKIKSISGMILPFAEQNFQISNLQARLLYDSTEDAVAVFRAVKGA